MNTPVAKLRQRVLLILAATLACGSFTACHDDYDRHPRHSYRSDHRVYHRDYDRDDDYRDHRRGAYYGSGYRRSSYDAPSSVTVRRGYGPSVTVGRY